MIKIIKKQQCSGCHACVAACPKNCIQMQADEEGFWYPSVDLAICTDCGLCEKVCPIGKTLPTKGETPTAYAVINKDEKIREKSASGGAFTALAEYVLSQGGVVFGAAFADDFSVEHRYVDNKESLEIFRGSKYVQSRIGDTYRQAEKFLKEGRLVLFTGTPCQIGGLMAYLRKPYENLLTQDFICHGVPSPMVWQKYLEFRKSQAQESAIESVEFRNKVQGWRRFSMRIKFVRGEYVKSLKEDPMLKVFLKNLCLRPSCYECSFKTVEHLSDITLADFWGVEKVLPGMFDDKGTSLILIQSSKGREVFERIKNLLIYETVDLQMALLGNSSIKNSSIYPIGRDMFMKDIAVKNFEETVQKYSQKEFLEESFWRRLKKKIVHIFKR